MEERLSLFIKKVEKERELLSSLTSTSPSTSLPTPIELMDGFLTALKKLASGELDLSEEGLLLLLR